MAAGRRSRTCTASISRARSLSGGDGRRGVAHRVLPADAHRHAGWPWRSWIAFRRASIPPRTSAPTASTRRSTREILRLHGAQTILGPEVRRLILTRLAASLRGRSTRRADRQVECAGISEVRRSGRVVFITPDRSDLPALNRYATLQVGGGAPGRRLHRSERRGCKHRWPALSHCPGCTTGASARFRSTSSWRISARRWTGGRAAHHVRRSGLLQRSHPLRSAIVERLAREVPGVSYDVTIKGRALAAAGVGPCRGLREHGFWCVCHVRGGGRSTIRCWRSWRKGHTHADFVENGCVTASPSALALSPTFVAFHRRGPPSMATCWQLREIDRLGLVSAHLADPVRDPPADPARPPGMLELDDVRGRDRAVRCDPR